MSAEDDLARLRANVDQAQAALGEFAGVLGRFRDELVEQGFTRQEALALCIALLAHQLRQPSEDDEP